MITQTNIQYEDDTQFICNRKFSIHILNMKIVMGGLLVVLYLVVLVFYSRSIVCLSLLLLLFYLPVHILALKYRFLDGPSPLYASYQRISQMCQR